MVALPSLDVSHDGSVIIVLATMAKGATMVRVSVLVHPIESDTSIVYKIPPLKLLPVGPLPPVGDH